MTAGLFLAALRHDRAVVLGSLALSSSCSPGPISSSAAAGWK
jgi:hypothetical protein